MKMKRGPFRFYPIKLLLHLTKDVRMLKYLQKRKYTEYPHYKLNTKKNNIFYNL